MRIKRYLEMIHCIYHYSDSGEIMCNLCASIFYWVGGNLNRFQLINVADIIVGFRNFRSISVVEFDV